MFEEILAHQSFFQGMPPQYLKWLAYYTSNVSFEKGEYIFKEGQPAEHFYLVLHGRVALEVAKPHGVATVVQTLCEDEALGWSWLWSPYLWHFDAKSLDDTRLLCLEAIPIRVKCEQDHDFGYFMMQRVAALMLQRLQATRLQLLDIHHNPA